MFPVYTDTLEEVCQRQVDWFVEHGEGTVSSIYIMKKLYKHGIVTAADFNKALYSTLEDIRGFGEQHMKVIIRMRREIRRGFGY